MRAMSVKRLVLGLALLVVVVGLSLVLFAPHTTPASVGVQVGQTAPDFTLSDLSGRPHRLSQLRGHVALINFFATWCIPCRQEMPVIEAQARRHVGPFFVYEIDKQEPASDVGPYIRGAPGNLNALLDPTLLAWNKYHVHIQPESFWIDRGGVVQKVEYGAMSAQTMVQTLHSLGVA